jgi:hypothetical protein
MKRNVTVVLDEETARWVRVEAARNEMSVSRWLGDLLSRQREKEEGYAQARASFMGRPPRPLGPEGAPLPRREDLYTRS